MVPGCESYEVNVDRPGGFVMPHPPRDSRTFPTESGRAEFTVSPIEALRRATGSSDAADHAQPRPVQHHDLRPQRPLPRHRGRSAGGLRQPRDLEELGFAAGDIVDLVTHWPGDDHVRAGTGVPDRGLPDPARCAAAYYPETNPLVPLDSTAVGSNTPTSKSVIIRLERPGTGGSAQQQAARTAVGADEGITRAVRSHAPVLISLAAAVAYLARAAAWPIQQRSPALVALR